MEESGINDASCFFDPLNKKVYMKESGNIDSIQYIEDPGAIEVQEDRHVRFRFLLRKQNSRGGRTGRDNGK